MKSRCSMIIQWSGEDDAYVVSLPEFPVCQTHGSTYEEAVRMGEEALVEVIETFRADGRALPEPLTLQATGDPWDSKEGSRSVFGRAVGETR